MLAEAETARDVDELDFFTCRVKEGSTNLSGPLTPIQHKLRTNSERNQSKVNNMELGSRLFKNKSSTTSTGAHTNHTFHIEAAMKVIRLRSGRANHFVVNFSHSCSTSKVASNECFNVRLAEYGTV